MKAITLQPRTTNLSLKTWEEPQIQRETEFKAKVLRVGICGTDREEAAGGRADAPYGSQELIIGHEMLSQVVAVGKQVTSIKPGDFVVITVRRGCGACSACQLDRSDMCTSGNYTERGIKGRHGFQSEFVVDEEKYAVKVPSSIAPIAVLTEPMSVVQKAIEEACLVQQNRLPYFKGLSSLNAVVAGLGPIGLLAALALRLRGAAVYGIDIVPPTSPRAQILHSMGGVYINDKTLNPVEFQKQVGNIDLIFDAAGIAKLDFDLLDLLGINGLFVLTGVPGEQRLIDIDGARLMRQLVLKNQVMLGSVNESIDHFKKGISDFEAAAKKWPGLLERFITQKYPPDQFMKALTQHTSDEIKVIIEWSAP